MTAHLTVFMFLLICTCFSPCLHVCRTKKVSVPVAVFNQVLGRNSCNLMTIRQATNTQIDVDKHTKQSANRLLTVRSVYFGAVVDPILLMSYSFHIWWERGYLY